MLGFLHLLTNQKVTGDSTNTVAAALQLYDRWTEDPRVELVSEPRGAETLFRQAMAPFAPQPGTKAIADCYLIGFAEAVGAHVVPFDRGLAATAKFRHVPVALHEPFERAEATLPSKKRKSRGKQSE
jgi:predicted nucleic acid-binding protein